MNELKANSILTEKRASGRSIIILGISLLLGIIIGLSQQSHLLRLASQVSDVFLSFLQLISLPLIFLAIVTSIAYAQNMTQVKNLGGKFLKYTILTTLIAAVIGLACYYLFIPPQAAALANAQSADYTYLGVVSSTVPSTIMKGLTESKVLIVALLAFVLGLGMLIMPQRHQHKVQKTLGALVSLFTQLTKLIIKILPIGICAFTVELVQQLQHDFSALTQLAYYAVAVLVANSVQGLVTLPLLLKIKSISPLQLFKAVFPALSMAFFTKSSSATLPLTVQCITQNSQVSPKTANFGIPICSIINMNGCASFILITVLFVSSQAGISFSFSEACMWTLIATLAAVGNASVPMGCYFLSSALLMSINVPLDLMGQILALYLFFDMVETALNVWSDCAVTKIVDQEISHP
jgi:Na+/H+-dicarboxylate symporter